MPEIIDTIVARATPDGRAALATIRISGPRARGIVSSIAKRIFKDRSPTLCVLWDQAQQLIDEALVTVFEAPRSYTGEDLVEISCHGNPVVVEKIIAEIVSRGTRLAEPGEFTQRAMANEKIRADQVEGLDWLLNARTMDAARAGLKAKLGQVGASVETLRGRLIDLLARLEADLDFSEEEVGALDSQSAAKAIIEMANEVEGWISAYERNRAYLQTTRVVLVGRPNSGKSSLFNALIGIDKAIVFEEPGTTRDLVEHEILLRGRPVTLVDTAGIRAGAGEIERLGIERTLGAARTADVLIWACDRGLFDDPELSLLCRSAKVLRVETKADLKRLGANSTAGDYLVSSLTGEGLDGLRLALTGRLSAEQDGVSLTSSRQAELALSASKSLRSAAEVLGGGGQLDRAVGMAGQARNYLEEITGRVTAEDVLASIFSRFCIGK